MKLDSKLNPRSDEFKTNQAAMQKLVDELEEKITAVSTPTSHAQQKFREAGKLLPRQRLELLLDPGTPFLELSPLAANGMYNDESPAASNIICSPSAFDLA